mgnify:FL=1
MDPIFEIELEDCPVCRGAGVMQDEQGWCVSVACMDCGAETAHADYRTPEERLEAARRVALLWNMGKVIHTGVDAAEEVFGHALAEGAELVEIS